eukprot:PhM_4_TR13839/c0_g1_i1/m.15668
MPFRPQNADYASWLNAHHEWSRQYNHWYHTTFGMRQNYPQPPFVHTQVHPSYPYTYSNAVPTPSSASASSAASEVYKKGSRYASEGGLIRFGTLLIMFLGVQELADMAEYHVARETEASNSNGKK